MIAHSKKARKLDGWIPLPHLLYVVVGAASNRDRTSKWRSRAVLCDRLGRHIGRPYKKCLQWSGTLSLQHPEFGAKRLLSLLNSKDIDVSASTVYKHPEAQQPSKLR